MIRHRSDWLPCAIVSSACALALLPFFVTVTTAALAAIALVSLMGRSIAPVHQHCHAHYKIFRAGWLNHLYDAILLFAAGNTTACWEYQHVIGHHRHHLSPTTDVAGTLRFGAGDGIWHRLRFTLCGDALSVRDALRFAGKGRARLYTQLALHIVFIGLAWNADWRAALVLVLLPHVALRWFIFWFSYGQHHGARAHSVYNGSYTHFGWQNAVFLNVGHHTAHHEKPTLHWTLLPARTQQILSRIPPECLR